jgi:hypothetical protein
MVCYFDSFLFSIVSVEEMVDATTKETLRNIDVFRFVKALRNITGHHSVLAGQQSGTKFIRPFNRHIVDGDDRHASSNLAISYDNFRTIFNAVEAEWPREKPTLDVARSFLSKIEAGPQPVYIERVLRDALDAVAAVVF